jgi:hypothetical protein
MSDSCYVWVRTADAEPPKQIGLVRTSVYAFVVEHFADLDAAIEQLFAGGRNVGDDQVKVLGGAGHGGGDVPAKDEGASRVGRGELDHAEVAAVIKISVEPPPELPA